MWDEQGCSIHVNRRTTPGITELRPRHSRAGNRKANHVIRIAATQIRLDTPGRPSYRRKLAAGKTPLEAMRCLQRRVSDAHYRQPSPVLQLVVVKEPQVFDVGAVLGGYRGILTWP